MEETTNNIICADVLSGLELVADGSVHLIFTSPPYNLKINYGNHIDDMPYNDYLAWLKKIFIECKRVLAPGGRIAINIDAMTNRQGDKDEEYVRCIYAHIYNIMIEVGLLFRTEICWYKQNSVGKATAWGCYDETTRVMTDSGLKFFKDIDIKSDKFATLNPLTKEVEYNKSINYIDVLYSGDMLHFKNSRYDLLVTPNHNMFVYNKYLKINELKTAEKCSKNIAILRDHHGLNNISCEKSFVLPSINYGRRTRKTYIKDELNIDMDDWLRFLGIFFTDGNVYYNEKNRIYKVSIYQKKDKYMNEIKALLNRLPFDFKYKKNKYEFYTCSKQLSHWLKSFSNKNNRKVPNFVLDLSKRQKQIFIDWLFIGDGCSCKTPYLAVSSDSFVDKLTKIMLDVGLKFSIHKVKRKDYIYKGKLFRSNKSLNIININVGSYFHLRNQTKKYNYNGHVYCVEVPNNIIFVERNGKFTWSGNSYLSCSNPIIRRNHEYILVFSKDTWKLKGDSELSDMTKEEFEAWTFSTWFIHPETKKMGGHPVPFPEELAKRVIKLFSYRGNTVMDIFSGSGTVPYIAYKHGRNCIGIDNEKKYCNFARDRIEQVDNSLFSEVYIPRSERIKAHKMAKQEKERLF